MTAPDAVAARLKAAASDAGTVACRRLALPRSQPARPQRFTAWLVRNRLAIVLVVVHVILACAVVTAVELFHGSPGAGRPAPSPSAAPTPLGVVPEVVSEDAAAVRPGSALVGRRR